MLRTLKVLFLTATVSLLSFGQKGTHTPYSSFGLGEFAKAVKRSVNKELLTAYLIGGILPIDDCNRL